MLDLMQPTIDMCRNGIEVSWSAVEALTGQEELILKDPGMRLKLRKIINFVLIRFLIFLPKLLQLAIESTYRQIFIDPATNKTWKEGQFYKRENFADTLERIGKNGLQEFYTGDTAKALIDDLNQQNSILTLKDLYGYR